MRLEVAVIPLDHWTKVIKMLQYPKAMNVIMSNKKDEDPTKVHAQEFPQ